MTMAMLRMCWREADNISPGIARMPWRYFIGYSATPAKPFPSDGYFPVSDKIDRRHIS
jgi:hypothetical protein